MDEFRVDVKDDGAVASGFIAEAKTYGETGGGIGLLDTFLTGDGSWEVANDGITFGAPSLCADVSQWGSAVQNLINAGAQWVGFDSGCGPTSETRTYRLVFSVD